MNAASVRGIGEARRLRDLFSASDAALDPQAYVLRPDIVLKIAGEIVAEATPYDRTRRAAISALTVLREAHASGELELPPREVQWLERLLAEAEALPNREEVFVEQMAASADRTRVPLEDYDLGVMS